MHLYEITSNLRSIVERLAESDDPETASGLSDELENVAGQWEDKIRACLVVRAEMRAEADAIESEIERLRKLRDSKRNSADRMTRYVESNMIALDIRKLDLGIFKPRIQRNRPSLCVDNESLIPAEYVRVVETRIVDKLSILEAISAGAEIPGCHTEQSESLRV